MKRTTLCFILAVIMFACSLVLSACSSADTDTGEIPALKDIGEDYSVKQAKDDGCIVYENGDIVSGQKIWDEFENAVSKGNEASVRLAFYYTLSDPSHYDPEYYKLIKDMYPMLFIQELEFDTQKYTVKWYEEGKEICKEYKYMMKYEGEAENPGATYSSYLRYVLTNDNTVTWDDIYKGMLNSQAGAAIDHYVVYIDLIK